MRLNKVTTKKGTLEFKHVGPAYDFDSAAEAFDILLDGRKILTLLLDCADAEVGLYSFYAYDSERQNALFPCRPQQRHIPHNDLPADAEFLGDTKKSAMAKLKALVDLVF